MVPPKIQSYTNEHNDSQAEVTVGAGNGYYYFIIAADKAGRSQWYKEAFQPRASSLYLYDIVSHVLGDSR